MEKNGKFDVYIDDFIGVAVDLNNNKSRFEVAPCTVIHAVSNNPSNEEIIPRDDIIEVVKFKV